MSEGRTRKRGRPGGLREIGPAEIRQDVASWPREKLEEFVVEQILASPALFDQVRRRLKAAASPEAGLAQIVADIDRALDVDFVDWRDVDPFIDRLGELLADIDEMARLAPDHAVRAIEHFIRTIGTIFDRVNDECELAMFCTSLAEDALRLSAASSPGIWPMIRTLLQVYNEDDYGRFDEVPELVAKASLDRSGRLSLAEMLDTEAAQIDRFAASRLLAIADRLRRARGPRKKP